MRIKFRIGIFLEIKCVLLFYFLESLRLVECNFIIIFFKVHILKLIQQDCQNQSRLNNAVPLRPAIMNVINQKPFLRKEQNFPIFDPHDLKS